MAFRFAPPISYPTGNNPGAAQVADFNRDGVPDLAVVNANFAGERSSVSVLIGRRDGTFRPAVNTLVPGGPAVNLVLGDFNRDGKVDFAVDHSGSGPATSNAALAVYLGQGDGTFRAPTQVPLPSSARGTLLVGDFNGDRKLDLAETIPAPVLVAPGAARTPGEVVVFPGNGDGTFRAGVATVGPLGGEGLVGDFNRDGRLDLALVVAPVFADRAESLYGVRILPGRGDGTFGTPIFTPTSTFVEVRQAGRFDGDRTLDLVAVDHGASDTSGVSILPGRGDGTFGTPLFTPIGPGTLDLAVGDFDRDGRPEVVASLVASSGASGIVVLPGRGRGRFGPASTVFPAGPSTLAVAAGDFNRDGRSDLAVTNAFAGADSGTGHIIDAGVSILINTSSSRRRGRHWGGS